MAPAVSAFPGAGMRFYRLTELPGPPREEADGTQRGRLVSSLTASHAALSSTDAPALLLSARVRPPGSSLMQVVLGGRPSFPPAMPTAEPGREQPVLFPVGARGREVAETDVMALLESFDHWVACVDWPDPLWSSATGRSELPPRRGSFDRVSAHLAMPFAWLVVAEPVPTAELDDVLDALVTEILPLSRAEVGEAARVRLERKQARHRELNRARAAGVWRTRVVVGALRADLAVSVAAMLCAACDLDGLPHVLTAGSRPMPLAEALTTDAQNPDGVGATVLAGPDLLAALAGPGEREMPGIRVVEPKEFDVTPEDTDGDVVLGEVLDEADATAGTLTLRLDALNRHTFVCGATGSGKSMTVRHLLTEATAVGIPWLVIEPAKAEYALMAGRIANLGADVVVIRPGDPDRPPAGFNPMEPAPGFALQTHVDMLAALFLASFEAHEPFPQILDAALLRSYEEAGWDLSLGEPVGGRAGARYPTLADLQRVAAQVVGEIGYGPELAADVSGFIKVRLDSLRLGTTGRFFEGGHRLDFDRLLRSRVVLEIEDVGDDTDKAFLMGAVLLRLTETLRVAARDPGWAPGLRHLTVVEEAHRLLRRPDPGAAGATGHAVETFASLLAEVRAYGEGLIIAEQIPSKLINDVLKNTAVKIVHRLPADDDRQSVGATINLGEDQSRVLVALRPGVGAVSVAGMDRPMRVHVPAPADREVRAATPVPLGDLITAHSVACADSPHPCTLRTIRLGHQLLTAEPALVVWAELTVLSHLTGQTPPMPTEGLRATLRGNDPEVMRCAVGQAVEAAVSSRLGVMQPATDAAALTAHAAELVRAGLDGAEAYPACAGHPYATLASHYRWLEPWASLSEDVAAGVADGRHPHSDEWEHRLRQPIPGSSRAEQLGHVEVWWGRTLADRPARDRVTFGQRRPSGLELALWSLGGGVPWAEQVDTALARFAGLRWPRSHLVTSTDGA